jgi:hypothetical protein
MCKQGCSDLSKYLRYLGGFVTDLMDNYKFNRVETREHIIRIIEKDAEKK